MTKRSVVHDTFVIDRTCAFKREFVYAAWTSPEAKSQWFVAPRLGATTSRDGLSRWRREAGQRPPAQRHDQLIRCPLLRYRAERAHRVCVRMHTTISGPLSRSRQLNSRSARPEPRSSSPSKVSFSTAMMSSRPRARHQGLIDQLERALQLRAELRLADGCLIIMTACTRLRLESSLSEPPRIPTWSSTFWSEEMQGVRFCNRRRDP